MTTLSPDALALLAALDAGDDGVLPILADELELSGDPRAAGLRFRDEVRPMTCGMMDHTLYGWLPGDRAGASRAHCEVGPAAFSRLKGYAERAQDRARYYPTRALAFLALAEALAGG